MIVTDNDESCKLPLEKYVFVYNIVYIANRTNKCRSVLKGISEHFDAILSHYTSRIIYIGSHKFQLLKYKSFAQSNIKKIKKDDKCEEGFQPLGDSPQG